MSGTFPLSLRTWHLALLASVFALVSSFGQEKKPAMEGRIFNAPPSFIDNYKGSSVTVEIDGVHVKGFDLRPFLESQGMTMPPGSQATIIDRSNAIFIKSSPEFLDLITSLFDSTGGSCNPPYSIRTQMTLVRLLAPDISPTASPPSYDQLYSKSNQSWKVISALETLTRSGVRAIATAAVRNDTGQPFTGELLTDSRWGVEGAIFEQEIVIGPDGTSFDGNFSYHFRGAGNDTEPAEIKFTGTMAGGMGQPQVVQFLSGGPAAPSYALIIRVDIVMPGGQAVPKDPPVR